MENRRQRLSMKGDNPSEIVATIPNLIILIMYIGNIMASYSITYFQLQ